MTDEARITFGKDRLEKLPTPEAGKRKVYHDTKAQGLQLRVSATGNKTFSVYRRIKGGQPERITLGSFPAMTVEQARKSAAAINAEIEAGASPAKARRAIRSEPTFLEVFNRYLVEKKKRNGTRLTEKTKINYADVVRIYLNTIKNKKLSQITRSELKTIHTKASMKSHAQADRAVRLVSAVFSFAIDLELFDKLNPASRIQKNEAVERDRFALPHELPHLLTAMEASTLRDYFLLSLLTGARRSNVQEMAWRDIDLEAGTWRIGMTKNGTPQNVTLSPEAVSTLKSRRSNVGTSQFVFASSGKTGHLVEPKTAWATILRRATTYRILELLEAESNLSEEERQHADKLLAEAPVTAEKRYRAMASTHNIDPTTYDITDLRIHDLRRTLGSWQAKTGASLVIIGKSLNHKSTQSTRIYARLDDDPVRQSVNTATAAMMAAGSQKNSAEVLELRQRGKR